MRDIGSAARTGGRGGPGVASTGPTPAGARGEAGGVRAGRTAQRWGIEPAAAADARLRNGARRGPWPALRTMGADGRSASLRRVVLSALLCGVCAAVSGASLAQAQQEEFTVSDASRRALYTEYRSASGNLATKARILDPSGAVLFEVMCEDGDGCGLRQRITDRASAMHVVLNGSNDVVDVHSPDPYGNFEPRARPGGSGRSATSPARHFMHFELDEELGVYRSPTRLYVAELGRFASRDVLAHSDSSYAYVGGNPVNRIDPTGLIWWDLNEALDAVPDAMVSAARSVAHRSAVPAGAGVGAAIGGWVGQRAMRGAMNAGATQRGITWAGMIASGAAGAIAGGVAAGVVASAAHGEPFASAERIGDMVGGSVGGAIGGILRSDAYLGLLSPVMNPTHLRLDEASEITRAVDTHRLMRANERLVVMAPQDDATHTAREFQRRRGGYQEAMRLDFGDRPRPAGAPRAGQVLDTIAAHGNLSMIFVSVDTTGDTYPDQLRPMRGRDFAEYLVRHTDLARRTGPIKLISCFAAFCNAQLIADALGREVWAGYPIVNRYTFTNWVRFTPRPR